MKKVLITGGNGDIAISIRKVFQENGYLVFAPGKNELDVTNVTSIENYISSCKPDILINNAGYVISKTIKMYDLENTKKQIDINLTGVFYCSELALKYNKNVQIINICSAASIESHPTWSEYCATKAGVAMATKCWAEDGIDTIAISPGRTKTKMRRNLFPNEDQNTLMDTDDFALVVLMAANHKFKNGENIIVRKTNVQDILKGVN